MSTTVGGIRVEVEKDERSEGLHWRLVAHWTPAGQSERRLALGTSTSGWEISYLQGAVDAMLRHAYEQGRVDASLGV